MRARISEIPPAEEATWGAVLAVLVRTHPGDLSYHWTSHKSGPDGYSVLDITEPGEDVQWMRVEIERAVDIVNEIVKRDPLEKMIEVDKGHIEVVMD
jgi:hypothetical protein